MTNFCRPFLLSCLVACSAWAAPTLVISFGSVCCGTDHEAHARVEAALEGTKATRSSKHWGKEGEFDLCLDLAPLSATERTALTEKLKTALLKSKHVSLREGGSCDER